MGGLATLLLGLATPDTTREWKPIPGVGQPPPTAEDLDLLRRFSTPQEVVDRALIAPRLLPVLEAERVPAVAEMLLLLPATEINATLLRDSLALKVGLQRARVTLTGVGPYGGGWDWPETVRLDPRTHAPFVPHATNTTRVAFQIEPAGGRSWEQEHQRDTLLRFQRLFTKGLLPHANAPSPLEGDFPYVLLSLHVFAEGQHPSPEGKHASSPAPRTAVSLLVDSPQAQPAATPRPGTPGGQTAAPLSASEMQPAAEPTEHCAAGFSSECVDGSCHRPEAMARGVCTLGCPAGRLRCADGSCIGNATTRCAPPLVKLQAVSEATVVDVSVLRPLPLEVHADDGSTLAHLSLPQWAYGVGRPRLRVVVTRVPHAEALRLLPLANRSVSNLLRSPAFRLSVGIAGAEDLPAGLSPGAADAAQMSDLEAPLLPEPAKLRLRCQVGAVASDEARKRDIEALCLARLEREGEVSRWRCRTRPRRHAPPPPNTHTHTPPPHCTYTPLATFTDAPLSTRPAPPPHRRHAPPLSHPGRCVDRHLAALTPVLPHATVARLGTFVLMRQSLDPLPGSPPPAAPPSPPPPPPATPSPRLPPAQPRPPPTPLALPLARDAPSRQQAPAPARGVLLESALQPQPLPAGGRPRFRLSSVVLVLTLVPAAVISFISLFVCRHIRNRRPGPFKAQRRRRDPAEVTAPVGEAAAGDDQELENRSGKDE